ncbi:hypothetical protein A1D31_14320 [Bradyrhizobium liaoningense]|nr:hypothetical protein A1D31_14320 [Bradyrhizobium liaoningense]
MSRAANRAWSEDELSRLRTLWLSPGLYNSEIVVHMGRPRGVIERVARRLGLPPRTTMRMKLLRGEWIVTPDGALCRNDGQRIA